MLAVAWRPFGRPELKSDLLGGVVFHPLLSVLFVVCLAAPALSDQRQRCLWARLAREPLDG